MGIEPTYSAWKAEVLPLNYTRKTSSIFLKKADPLCKIIQIFTSTAILFGGGGRIRTSEGRTSRFTICPLWPLGNPSKNQAAYFA